MKNNITGKSFNDLIKPVPNALSDSLMVILEWREQPTTVIYDLSKAYQSIRTGLQERHLRRFFYRPHQQMQFKTFAIDCNNFGDACASLGLELGKENDDGTIPIAYTRWCPFSPVEEHRLGGEHIISVVFPDNNIVDNFANRLREIGLTDEQIFFPEEAPSGTESEPAEASE